MTAAPRPWRPLIMGRDGAVASNHPLATQAGLDVLRAGGTAADASVAVSLTLGVVEPHMSGLGGDGLYHHHDAGRGTAMVYNGTGAAPASATPESFPEGMAVQGPRSVSIPGSVAGLAALHAAHGRLPWYRLASAAIARARDGFAATHTFHHHARDSAALLRRDPRAAAQFLPDGAAPALGGLVCQPALARTLEELAQEGPDSFYRGRLAARLAEGMEASGVPISAADLAGCMAETVAPIAITYRGFEVRQTPPNSTGFTMLQMLKIAERFDLAEADPARRIHLLVEAKKRAFLDRERYGGDPRFVEIPLERLLSDAHADALAASIDPDRAAELPLDELPVGSGDTTYFCVVDAEGNVVSGIQSLNGAFGSGVIAGETGVLLNNRMAYWHLRPGHANRLQPGRRVRHTMNAQMVFRDGRFWGVLGTPGADHQVQVNLQVLVAMIDLDQDPQTALEAPRWSSSQPGQGANWPHEGDGRLTIEDGMEAGVYEALTARGHRLARVGRREGPCSVNAIRLLDNGVRMAASDPRRDGWAGAY
jgi:gamma-glutamyltranspeptidase/glutathione hydrolase